MTLVELPTGTVTFLFTDLEGSTRLWEEHPEEMKDALARHDDILRHAVESNGGVVFSTMGDGIAAVFSSAPDALRGVLDAQLRLGAAEWGETGPLRVRMGLHSDEGRLRAPGEYVNRPLNRCARLMAVAHGGQVLVSDATATVARDGLPDGAGLVDLGQHRLRDLAGAVRVFQLLHPELPSEFGPLRSLDALPGNLPRQVTTFVGRDAEIASLSRLARERPLVTLTGVGGVGKTRLAVQVAAEVVPEFPEGAWVCELAPVTDPDAVWETLAASLGVHPSPGRKLDDSVLEYLAPKRLLLVLDNCEHLLDAVAELVGAITQRCPDVAMLATSREGLALAGEQIVAIPSLGVPAGDTTGEALANADAVRLFVDRAHDAKADFTLTDRNAEAVAQLCRRLDGIPLAIELAAARVRSLTPEDLVERLDQRFKLLTRGSRAALERHQTLRNTVDWSYDLLNPTERVALNRLSVFAGGADLLAAEAVMSGDDLDALDVADVLGQLVDKSLVLVDDDHAGARYRLLETIRQYAQERLETAGDAAVVRRRHAEHYVTIAEESGPRLRGAEQIAAADAVARDTDNFRAALDWAVETGSVDLALRLVAPLAVNGMAIGYSALDWADTACSVAGASDHHCYPSVASWAVWRATMRGDLARAEALAARVAEAEQRLGVHEPAACQGPATLAFFSGDFDLVRQRAEEWLDRARVAADPYESSHALIMLGSALNFANHPDSGIPEIEEAVRIARDANIASTLGMSLSVLGMNLPLDQVTRRLALLEEAIDVGTRLGDQAAVATATGAIGWIALWRRDWAGALPAIADAAEQFLRSGMVVSSINGACFGMGIALAHLGHPEPAAVLIGAADALMERDTGAAERSFAHAEADFVAEADALLLETLGPERLAALRAQGAAMDYRQAVECLRTEAQRARSDD
ncbi:MAG: adenylate/guanylate cyclase domain-containing protein [Acidimicrobiia bacterium]|nr:adenylate/guanylate cyclase domain-containing protein [Acidimicrobiia bacterium]